MRVVLQMWTPIATSHDVDRSLTSSSSHRWRRVAHGKKGVHCTLKDGEFTPEATRQPTLWTPKLPVEITTSALHRASHAVPINATLLAWEGDRGGDWNIWLQDAEHRVQHG